MDYITFDTLRKCHLKRVAFTYDIFCKWWIHLAERSRTYYLEALIKAFQELTWRGFIPKMHIFGHGSACWDIWSLNYAFGVGRTDGESTERDWASVVVGALQSAEMNPAFRQAFLDNHWIDKNFRRLVGLSERPPFADVNVTHVFISRRASSPMVPRRRQVVKASPRCCYQARSFSKRCSWTNRGMEGHEAGMGV
jgi:hypothetical protein